MMTSKRTCPFCAEEINSAAKVCPRCRQCLTLRSFRHPATVLLVIGFPLFLVILALTWTVVRSISRLGNPEPHYTQFLDSIKVLDARMSWIETGNGPSIFVTDMLTNQSAQAWKDLEFECRFYDKSGAMIDAANPRAYYTVLPADDLAFRVSMVPGRVTNEYSSFRISVNNAKNAKGWF
jgi:hypothetical protein